jgi:hypothetical protein
VSVACENGFSSAIRQRRSKRCTEVCVAFMQRSGAHRKANVHIKDLFDVDGVFCAA